MNCEYFCNKKTLVASEIEEAQIFFANGDFFTLSKKEIIDIKIVFYDELRVGERSFCPIAKCGFVKCKINNKKNSNGDHLLYKNSEYGKDIKEYLENRCIKEGGIRYMRLFDENHWHLPFYCIATAFKEDDFLVFEFQAGVELGGADSEFHYVRARNITKNTVEKIELDFENCDGIEVFQEEIQDININFEKELCWSSFGFTRQVRNGFIRLKFNDEFTWRDATIACGRKKNTLKNLTHRICGKGHDEIDICHLYVTYDGAGYCLTQEECIEVNDIRPLEVQEEDYLYISGHAKKEKDGSILIVFGKQKN